MLGRDVFDGRSSAIPLLRAGVKLTERHRRALISAGVNAVYVQDDLSEGIDVRQVVDPGTRRRATVAVSRARTSPPAELTALTVDHAAPANEVLERPST